MSSVEAGLPEKATGTKQNASSKGAERIQRLYYLRMLPWAYSCGGSSSRSEDAFCEWIKRVASFVIGLEEVPTAQVAELLGWYTGLASSMLFLNKQAVGLMPYPRTLLLLQLASAVIFVGLMAATRQINVRLLPGTETMVAWLVVAVGFLASIWCSMKTLRHSDVSWYMVLHYTEPLGVCLMDWKLLNHPAPTLSSMASLLVLLLSSIMFLWWRTGYPYSDSVLGTLWGIAWVVVMTVYLTFLKYAISTYQTTPWERVLYLNLYALLTTLAITAANILMCPHPLDLNQILQGTCTDCLEPYHADSATPEVRNATSAVLFAGVSEDFGGGTAEEATAASPPAMPCREANDTLWDQWHAAALPVVLSCVCGIGLSYSKLHLLQHISVTSYAMFAVVALFPVRVWQGLYRVG